MLCPQSKKVIHLSRGKAEAHLRSLKDGYTGRVYPCEHCGGWHVGREKKNAHKDKYKEEK
jgi:hypothetical protein